MRNRIFGRWLRVAVPGACLLQLSGCLSDQQITSIITSVITAALNTIVSEALAGIAGGATM
jgi:hypothetical protein